MPAVAKPPRVPRANETRDITHPIRIALNKLPGVRVVRNNSGMLEWAPGKRLRYGLGLGSADLVGVVLIPWDLSDPRIFDSHGLGRAFCLEVKRPGVKPDRHQLAWLQAVRNLGGFATVVHSVDEAIEAVQRCREGESQ